MKLTIDGIETEVPPGTTVLDAARALGTDVPTLCFDERQEPFGACRVCMVGIEGAAPQAACTTPCREGMRVVVELSSAPPQNTGERGGRPSANAASNFGVPWRSLRR